MEGGKREAVSERTSDSCKAREPRTASKPNATPGPMAEGHTKAWIRDENSPGTSTNHPSWTFSLDGGVDEGGGVWTPPFRRVTPLDH